MKRNAFFIKFRLKEQGDFLEDFVKKTVLEVRLLGPGKVQELGDNVIQPV